MATIKVKFNFCNAKSSYDSHTEEHEFDSSTVLDGEVDDKGQDILDECSDSGDSDDEWCFDGYEVIEWEDEYGDPRDFADLDTYSEFVDNVDDKGEAFRLRYADLGGCLDLRQFESSYAGCHDSEKDYAQTHYEDCHDIPDHLVNHIDWDSVASELLMDYSTYDGNDGTHIFRD
jgi:antirestriction protein